MKRSILFARNGAYEAIVNIERRKQRAHRAASARVSVSVLCARGVVKGKWQHHQQVSEENPGAGSSMP